MKKLLICFLLIIITIITILPFFWMVTTSLKEPGTIFTYPPRWLPNNFIWHNYKLAWEAVPFGRGYINSIFIALAITFGQLATCSLAAYAFARLKFPGRDKIFFLYLATLMVPFHITMIPIFMLIRLLPAALNNLFNTQFWSTPLYLGNFYLGRPLGLDSYFALIIPSCFSAYGTFLLRQFFMTIPNDFESAAKMDGCNYFGIYLKIILPLAKPALATLATFTFMNAWKNYLWPLIVVNDTRMMPLSILLQWFQGLHTTNWTLLMAGNLIALVPIVIVFLLNQRYITSGIQIQQSVF